MDIAVIGTVIIFFLLLLGVIVALLVLLFGKKRDASQISEEEIKHIVSDTQDLQEDEKRLISEILNLGNMSVREIMKPRVDVIFADAKESVITVLERMQGTGYSRLPVFEEDKDRVVGVVYYKDLVEALLAGKEQECVAGFAFEPMYIPDSKDVLPLLSDMQMMHQQIAIVKDEYGGTAGLVTIEDIMEEIVGEIIDESDNERKLIVALNENEWLVDGRLEIDEALEQGFPVEESDEYETITGWLMAKTEGVPSLGAKYVIDDYIFKVEKMRRHRLTHLRVKRIPPQGE